MLMNTGDVPGKSQNGLITTLAACISDRPCYVLEGSVFVGGAVVKWLRDEMRLIRKAKKPKDMQPRYLIPTVYIYFLLLSVSCAALGFRYPRNRDRITRATKKNTIPPP